MARIKVTDERHGRTLRTGVNGRIFEIPVGSEQEVDDGLVDHLRGLGVRFEEVEDNSRGAGSAQGSEAGPALASPHDVRAPAMDAKSLDNSRYNGDQPGDVTSSGGVAGASGQRQSIEDAARISDIRVAAERRSADDAPAAELAGEGEQGLPEADPQPVEPSHQETDEEKEARKQAEKDEKKAKKQAKKSSKSK